MNPYKGETNVSKKRTWPWQWVIGGYYFAPTHGVASLPVTSDKSHNVFQDDQNSLRTDIFAFIYHPHDPAFLIRILPWHKNHRWHRDIYDLKNRQVMVIQNHLTLSFTSHGNLSISKWKPALGDVGARDSSWSGPLDPNFQNLSLFFSGDFWRIWFHHVRSSINQHLGNIFGLYSNHLK